MSARWLHAAPLRHAVAAAFACLTSVACARPMSLLHSEPADRLSFTNATQDRVTVYLAIGDARPWRLGSVEPFRTTSLPLPRFGGSENAGTARLVVRSVGTAHSEKTTSADAGVNVLSAPADSRVFLTTMRWTLVGQQLFSETPLPRKRPPSGIGPSGWR